MTSILFYIAALYLIPPPAKRAWLGLKDSGAGSDFRWVSDNTTVTFTNWQGGSPNTNGMCVALPVKTPAGDVGVWISADCLVNVDVLCEANRVNIYKML